MKSFLDTDFYKLTMQQAVFEHYPNTKVTYEFIDRKNTYIEKEDSFLGKLEDKISEIISNEPLPEQIRYLETLGYFKFEYLYFLKKYRFNSNNLEFYIKNGQLVLKVHGDWLETILWEIPLLAAITEIHCDDLAKPNLDKHFKNILRKKDEMGRLNFCEFGTRRRRNYDYQAVSVGILADAIGFIGTSNIHLAKMYDLTAVGTMAHELIMGTSAYSGVKEANAVALDKWTQTYQGSLGIALTDTFTTKVFLESFNGVRARTFDGIRQDSGSPVDFANRMHVHYNKLGVNPSHKKILFSDGLNPVRCQEINNAVHSPINKVYCIGTDFTNDQRLNVVMKLTKVNGIDVVKLSDEPGKETGKADAIKQAKIRLETQ